MKVTAYLFEGVFPFLFFSCQVEEQASFLSSRCTPIAVATPNRASKLIDLGTCTTTHTHTHTRTHARTHTHTPRLYVSEHTHTGSLKLEQLKCVLLDWYHRDQKQRRFSSVPEVCNFQTVRYILSICLSVRLSGMARFLSTVSVAPQPKTSE